MQLTQSLRRSARLFPTRAATICGDRQQDYATLLDRVARLAKGLSSLGIGVGDRVGILALNSDRYIEAYYAIVWAGAIAVPFNTRWAVAEMAYAFADSTPALMLLDESFMSHAELFAGQGAILVGLSPHQACPLSVDDLVTKSEVADDLCGKDDDVACLFYTGGTTGRAKAVMTTHRNLLSNFLAQNVVEPYDSAAVFLHTPPMFHMAGASQLFGLTMLGGTHVSLPSFDPKAVVEAIGRYGIDTLFLVPTMIGMLCEWLSKEPTNLSHIKRLIYGASPISEALLNEARSCLPGARFCQCYGQTELSPVATVLDDNAHRQGRLLSAGRPIPTVDLRIVDQDRHEVAPGEVGEIVVRSPGVMRGYWNQPELTAATIVDGWLHTGDAGRMDEEGYLYLVDRVKDMIVSGGENVYSAEVEKALLSHRDVLQCAVIGIPDERWGERVHAILQVREGAQLSDSDLSSHCEPLIANYKRPKSFDIRTAPLPMSAVGKILKAELRKPFWARHGRIIG